MKNYGEVFALRIFIGSTDLFNNQPLHEYIVTQAKRKDVAGATVIKGIMGYGASSVIHSHKFWEVSEKVPLIIELIDEEDKIHVFYEFIRPVLQSMKFGCLVTMQKVNVLMYKSGEQKMLQ